VGRSIQWRNVPAFNGGAVAEEEDERTVTCLKRLRFPISKAAFNLVLGILVILQSSPWLKFNWILAFCAIFKLVLGFLFLQFGPQLTLNFDISSIKSLISLIKLITSSIKSQNLSILQLSS
jgi:hypothetical protein